MKAGAKKLLLRYNNMASKKNKKQTSTLEHKDIITTEVIDIKSPIKQKIKAKKPPLTKKEMVTPKPEKFIPRLLCFSNIDTDLVCPLHILQNILGQSYTNTYYIFNIFINHKDDEIKYKKLLKSFLNPSGVKINFFLKEIVDIQDHFVGFTNTDYKNYNTFLYINALGVYVPSYIHSIMEQYNHTVDIINIRFHNNILDKNIYNYILNNKSLDILVKNKTSDILSIIQEHKLTTKEIYNDSSIIFKTENFKADVSSSNNIKYKLIEDDFFTICVFEHHFWSSYVYLNQRNHRMYNITNDDHGSFEFNDEKTINIQWDTWGSEIFHKKYIDDTIYYYSINE